MKSLATGYFVENFKGPHVRELVGWVRNVVLVNVYLDLGNPGGSGLGRVVYEPGEGNGEVSLQAIWERRWTDPVTARRVPSELRRTKQGSKRGENSKGNDRVHIHSRLVYIVECLQ